YGYAERVARTQSGNYLDLGVRVDDIAGPAIPVQETLALTLVPVNATRAETIRVPCLASYAGEPFKNKEDLGVPTGTALGDPLTC
ncbi:hypothetical protein BD413DRAFT_473647, partial [Trametes elegans]